MNTVAIPPYCSGQFQESRVYRNGDLVKSRNPTVLLRAIPSRSGSTTSSVRRKSQSHRTAQGNSKFCGVFWRASAPRRFASQSHRTAQGNSKITTRIPATALNKVAIPPYCSGQFQVQFVISMVTGQFGSQSHRTAQGNSKIALWIPAGAYMLSRNPTVLLRAIPSPAFHWQGRRGLLRESQSHRTAQGNSKEEYRSILGRKEIRRNPTVLLRAIPSSY